MQNRERKQAGSRLQEEREQVQVLGENELCRQAGTGSGTGTGTGTSAKTS